MKKNALGVVVGRFQVAELHKGHLHVINKAFEECERVVIYVGVSDEKFTVRDPLPYSHRRDMINESYPMGKAIICPIYDMPGRDEDWVRNLDTDIGAEAFPSASVMVYGSRDSFLQCYQENGGRFPTKEVGEYGTSSGQPLSGTNIRAEIARSTESSFDLRKGIIYAIINSHENKAKEPVPGSTGSDATGEIPT